MNKITSQNVCPDIFIENNVVHVTVAIMHDDKTTTYITFNSSIDDAMNDDLFQCIETTVVDFVDERLHICANE